MGGGVLLDLGVYAISFVSLVLGQPSSVISSVQIGATGVDEQVGAVLGFAGGAQAMLVVSLRADLPSDAVIVGTEGRLRVHAPLYRPEKITITRTSGPRRLAAESTTGLLSAIKGNSIVRAAYHHASRLQGLVPRSGRGTSVWPVEGNGYGYQAQEAMSCVLAGMIESPLLPHDETISVMETVDAVRHAWGDQPVG
jgi:predicted dehydrogenase